MRTPRNHLLTKDGLSFQGAIDLAKTLETAVKDLRELKGSMDTASVRALHRKAKQFTRPHTVKRQTATEWEIMFPLRSRYQ